MDIKGYHAEKKTHLKAKIKIAEKIMEREDIIDIEFEPLLFYRNRRLRVDLLAEKEDRSNIYIEVKSNANIRDAIVQLLNHQELSEGNNNEYMAVVKPFTNLVLKNIWRGYSYKSSDTEFFTLLKKAIDKNMTIWTYDDNYNFTPHKIKINKKSIIVDGEDVLTSKKIKIG